MANNLKNYKPKNPVNKTIKKISKTIKMSYEKKEKKGFSVITVTNNEIFIDNIFENYDRQIIKDKELIIVLNKNRMNIDNYKSKAKTYSNVKILRIDEKISLGSCLNCAVKIAEYDLIAKFDDDDYYGPKYLAS